jgi:hypothetical protein
MDVAMVFWTQPVLLGSQPTSLQNKPGTPSCIQTRMVRLVANVQLIIDPNPCAAMTAPFWWRTINPALVLHCGMTWAQLGRSSPPLRD